MRCIGYFYAITRLLPLKRNKKRHHTDTVTLYRYAIYENETKKKAKEASSVFLKRLAIKPILPYSTDIIYSFSFVCFAL